LHYNQYSITIIIIIIIIVGSAALGGHWSGFQITPKDAPRSIGLHWTWSDQLVPETSTWHHTTLTTDKHPCPRWDSNPQSQQTSGRRPTP